MVRPVYYLCRCARGRQLELLRAGLLVALCRADLCGCSCHQERAGLPFGAELLTVAEVRELALRLSDVQVQVWLAAKRSQAYESWWIEAAELSHAADVAATRRGV